MKTATFKNVTNFTEERYRELDGKTVEVVRLLTIADGVEVEETGPMYRIRYEGKDYDAFEDELVF